MSAPNPYFLPAHKVKSYYQTVTGPIDATYQLLWGTDTYSARPVKGTAASGSWTVNSSGGPVNLAALVNSNAISGVAIGLGATAALEIGPDGVPKNPFVFLETPVSPGSVSFGFTSADIATAGEFVFGEAFVLDRPFPKGTTRVYEALNIGREDDWGYMPSYDLNAKPRMLTTTLRVTQAESERFEAAWEGQRGLSLGSVLVPRPDKNDAWYGMMTAFSYRRLGPNDHEVGFSFREFSQCRW